MVFRFWSLHLARRKLYPDDYVCIAAFVSKAGMTGSQFWGTFNGLGKHYTELNEPELVVQAKYWDPKPTGWCRDTIIGDHATVAVNLVLDIAVIALPLPVLWRLRMSIRDKLTVTAMFSIGLITIAFVFWRLAVIQRTRSSPDWTGTICRVGIIAALEIYLGIIAVCIPTYGPLFNAYVKPAMTKLGISKSTSSSGPSARKPYLRTFGSSQKKGSKGSKGSRGYTEFTDSVDDMVSRDGSMKLAPRGEGKVVSECVSEPITETPTANYGPDGIHVQRDVEAIYQTRKGAHYDQ
ncbi:hypothetical protein O1611_g4918 [Lasiodiplodia mahajangana]|uniref:Uncharacterized protein n=1 Tax=Lasiodiplodia mahajangana TaxID=1108764 RepID=A0ACC2JMI4_9PEZI|nr:hypothetical protein O1611_g4918 [Lasiodiplodia mahajangana]